MMGVKGGGQMKPVGRAEKDGGDGVRVMFRATCRSADQLTREGRGWDVWAG